MTKCLSALLSSAVLLSAPGLGAYQVAAQQVAPAEFTAPIGGNPAVLAVGQAASDVTPSQALAGAAMGGSFEPAPAWVSAEKISANVHAATPAALPPSSIGASVRTAPAGVSSRLSVSMEGVEPPGSGFTTKQADAASDVAGARGRKAVIGTLFKAWQFCFGASKNADEAVPAGREIGGLAPGKNGDDAPVQGAGSVGPEQGRLCAPSRGPAPGLSVPAVSGLEKSSKNAKAPASPWRSATTFIAAQIVSQIGIEAWGGCWAKWVQNHYGMDHYSLLTMAGMVASLAAGYAGGWAVDKLGLKKSLLVTTLLVAASAAATLLLSHFHMLTFAPLLGLVIFRAFMNSAGATAQQTIPIAIFRENKGALEKYNSVAQFVLEIAGIGVPYFIGTFLGLYGPIGTMWIMPAALLGFTIVLGFFTKVSEYKASRAAGGQAGAGKENDPALLRIGMLGYPAFVLLNYLLYQILNIGYGNFVHPGSSELESDAAAGVAGKIASLYSAGGLLAALFLSGVPQAGWSWLKSKWPWLKEKSARVAARFACPAAALQDEKTAKLSSMARWIAFGAAGLAGFVPMLWTNPMLAALAMIPFGFTNVRAQLQLLSLVQENVPQERKGKVMGGIRTVSTLLAIGGLFGFSYLFKHYPVSTVPFVALLGLLAALGSYYLWVARKLKRYIASPEYKK